MRRVMRSALLGKHEMPSGAAIWPIDELGRNSFILVNGRAQPQSLAPVLA